MWRATAALVRRQLRDFWFGGALRGTGAVLRELGNVCWEAWGEREQRGAGVRGLAVGGAGAQRTPTPTQVKETHTRPCSRLRAAQPPPGSLQGIGSAATGPQLLPGCWVGPWLFVGSAAGNPPTTCAVPCRPVCIQCVTLK